LRKTCLCLNKPREELEMLLLPKESKSAHNLDFHNHPTYLNVS
jgi:hypothetical protein